jgi:putative transposase
MRRAYQSDLSDAEWSCLESYLPAPKANGRPRIYPLREILNAIFYVVRSGCAWRLLPHDFPSWKTVYHYFRFRRLDGTWERMHAALRDRVRVRLKRNPQPSAAIAAIVDSQSVKTTGVGGKERGYDGAKKVKGRKRHLLVDTQGLVLEARLHGAQIQDRDGIKLLLDIAARDRLPERLSHLWLDAGYTGEDKGAGWVQKVLGWTAEVVRHPPKVAPEEVMRAWVRKWNEEGVPIDLEKLLPPEGPRPFLPKRWVVERTFAWLGQNRRMSKDYERLPHSGEAFIYVAMSRLMARRLARS